MESNLIKFKTLIEEKTGIKVEDDAKLSFAIAEMIVINKIKYKSELFELIHNDKEEFENLICFLTINETYFFREPAHIDVFSNSLIPLLVKERGLGIINILSAGCSTGAEPYSLVIALMEKFGWHIKHLFSVKAFDIDKQALKIANEGVFGKYYFRGVDPVIIDKYFDIVGAGRYKIKSFVSEMVEFYPHNLLNSPPADTFQENHIIFYRNVSIYFSPENRRKMFMNLSDMLCEKGWLIMSSAETFPHDFKVLSLVNVDGVFLYRKKHDKFGEEDVPSITLGLEPLNHVNQKERSEKTVCPDISQKKPEPQILMVEELTAKKQYMEALVVLDLLIDENLPSAKMYAMKAGLLINLYSSLIKPEKLDEAKQACLKALAIDGFCLDAFFLLGFIGKLEENSAEAKENFKKAIYIDPFFWPAHYYLAKIYEACGEVDNAIKKYEIVVKQLEKTELLDTGVEFCAFPFSGKDLISTCRNSLEKLKMMAL